MCLSVSGWVYVSCWCDVWCYILYYYYISYYTLLFFLLSHLPLLYSPLPSQSSSSLSSLSIFCPLPLTSQYANPPFPEYVSVLGYAYLYYTLPVLYLLSFLSLFSHSFYTCRCLLLDTYISSSSNHPNHHLLQDILTPHVLSEWMVEVFMLEWYIGLV